MRSIQIMHLRLAYSFVVIICFTFVAAFFRESIWSIVILFVGVWAFYIIAPSTDQLVGYVKKHLEEEK